VENNRISLTPTVARQTPSSSFGSVLKDAVKTGGQVSGTLLNAIPGASIVSAAINSVTSLANQGTVARAAATGAITGNLGSVSNPVSTGTADVPASLSGMVDTMREEANRSMVMQMNMQQESREYNALSNVLKVRHDSAKAAINNLR
jgi:hypothetical protein